MNLKEQAVKLYLSGFPEDTHEFATDFTNRFFDKNSVYIEENGKLISMLYMFDCAILTDGKSLPVYYVYAVVTDPEYRGKGYMRKLMDKAKENAKEEGKEALIIKPSNEGLYSFYEKLGFKTAFYFNESEYVKSAENKIEFTFTDAKTYHKKREELLLDTSHVSWEGMLEYIGENGDFFVGADFCGLAEIEEQKLFLREFIGNKRGLDAILSKLSVKTATVRTIGTENPFGMICPLKDFVHDKMYMGFAMD